MTDINNINSIAREIVTNLDKQDGKEDGKIEASIWNKFVCQKQGNEIHNYINTNSAVKSVIAYLKREVAKTGQKIEDVANEWLKNVGGGNKTEIDETKYNKTDDDLTMKPVIIEEYKEDWDGTEIDEAHKQKVQQAADRGSQLLMDVANNKYRYEVKVEQEDSPQVRSVTLKDGRKISVILDQTNDDKYKISYLHISGSKKDHYGIHLYNDGHEGDCIQTSIYNVDHEGDVYSGDAYNEETKQSLLELAQKIFGDDIEV